MKYTIHKCWSLGLLLLLVIPVIIGCAHFSQQANDSTAVETLKTSMRLVTFGTLYKNQDLTTDIIIVTNNAISLIETSAITTPDELDQYLRGLAHGHKDEALSIFMIAEGRRLLDDILSQYKIVIPSETKDLMITILREVNETARLFIPPTSQDKTTLQDRLEIASRQSALCADGLIRSRND